MCVGLGLVQGRCPAHVGPEGTLLPPTESTTIDRPTKGVVALPSHPRRVGTPTPRGGILGDKTPDRSDPCGLWSTPTNPYSGRPDAIDGDFNFSPSGNLTSVYQQ